MALSVIFGKPGAGKSYFAVTKIVEAIEDYCRKEISTGSEHIRKIYTNLPLDLVAIDEYISDKLDYNIEASKYVVLLKDDFFVEKSINGNFRKIDWWKKFPIGAFIIIDEVHYYLSNNKDSGDAAYIKDFQNYISTHRHLQHDLIFLTQHTDNINKVCLNMASDAYHVVNIKGRVLPWLGIPFADIQVVQEAFGIKNQYANILYGNYVGRAFKPESTIHVLLKPEIYKLYRSHETSEASDRPSLELTRTQALFWFARRHFWHLLIKGILVYFVFYTVWEVICTLPLTLSDSLSKKLSVQKDNQSEKLPEPVKNKINSDVARSATPSQLQEVKEVNEKQKKPSISVITPDYIKIGNTRYYKGDLFVFNGVKYVVEKIDFDRRFVDFGMPDVAAGSEPSEPADSVQRGSGL